MNTGAPGFPQPAVRGIPENPNDNDPLHYAFTRINDTEDNALTPGPRILRAYRFEPGTDARALGTPRSSPVQVLLRHGAQTVDLVIE